jgi:hypothetical protein
MSRVINFTVEEEVQIAKENTSRHEEEKKQIFSRGAEYQLGTLPTNTGPTFDWIFQQ